MSSADEPQVEARFHEEESRTHHILSTLTTLSLQRILERNLITPHLLTIINMPNSGVDAMLDGDKLDVLARLFRLFLRVPGGLSTLRKALRETIIRRGKEVNELSTGDDGGESQQEDEPVEPSAKGKAKAKARPANAGTQKITAALKWVQDVLDLKDKFDKVWTKAFQSDRELEGGLNEVCPVE